MIKMLIVRGLEKIVMNVRPLNKAVGLYNDMVLIRGSWERLLGTIMTLQTMTTANRHAIESIVKELDKNILAGSDESNDEIILH